MRQTGGALVLSILLIGTTLATAQTGLQGPIENGDFESGVTSKAGYETLSGTPADECIGIGHQGFYGEASVAGKATGGEAGEPDAEQADPEAAVADLADDPVHHAQFQSGYGHCVYEPNGRGVDVVWFNPVDELNQPALWGVHPRIPSTEFGFDFDENPFDREARFLNDPSLSSHNLWQSYVSQPGAYTANFQTLEFTVEDGSIPDNARFVVSLASSPLERQSPFVAGYLECQLTFDSSLLDPGSDDRVVADPLDAQLTPDTNSDGTVDDECSDVIDTFEDSEASEAEKRDALGRLRMVQISFWGFNTGEEPVVIDDVEMTGARTVAHEVADGNVNACPSTGEDAGNGQCGLG